MQAVSLCSFMQRKYSYIIHADLSNVKFNKKKTSFILCAVQETNKKQIDKFSHFSSVLVQQMETVILVAALIDLIPVRGS